MDATDSYLRLIVNELGELRKQVGKRLPPRTPDYETIVKLKAEDTIAKLKAECDRFRRRNKYLSRAKANWRAQVINLRAELIAQRKAYAELERFAHTSDL